MKSGKRINLALVALVLAGAVGITQAQQGGVGERVAALKANMAASQAALRHYQWVETTVISMNGEQKSSKQAKCYYGADGTLAKVPLDASPPPEQMRGLRGRIAEEKKEELTQYMQQAVALVKTYVPPNPVNIQASKDSGKASLAGGANNVVLTFTDYEKPGDSLGVRVDPATSRVLGIQVATYLSDPGDAVTLAVTMNQLPDGTSYAQNTTLNAPAKGLTVNVNNDGYLKIN